MRVFKNLVTNFTSVGLKKLNKRENVPELVIAVRSCSFLGSCRSCLCKTSAPIQTQEFHLQVAISISWLSFVMVYRLWLVFALLYIKTYSFSSKFLSTKRVVVVTSFIWQLEFKLFRFLRRAALRPAFFVLHASMELCISEKLKYTP